MSCDESMCTAHHIATTNLLDGTHLIDSIHSLTVLKTKDDDLKLMRGCWQYPEMYNNCFCCGYGLNNKGALLALIL